jgi:hypothetical protein
MGSCTLDLSEPVKVQMVGYCKLGSIPSGSINCGIFLVYFRVYYLLKRHFAPTS